MLFGSRVKSAHVQCVFDTTQIITISRHNTLIVFKDGHVKNTFILNSEYVCRNKQAIKYSEYVLELKKKCSNSFIRTHSFSEADDFKFNVSLTDILKYKVNMSNKQKKKTPKIIVH